MNKSEQQNIIDERIREQRPNLDTQRKIQELEKNLKQLQDKVNAMNFQRDIEEIKKRLYFNEKLNEVFTSIPDYIPKTSKEQFAFYSLGGEKRLYAYIDGSWVYEIVDTASSLSPSISPSVSPSISPSVSPSVSPT